MKPATLFSLTVAAAAASVAAHDGNDPFEQWQGPKGGDVRGPCPFLNTFANHGFLPRTGKYITERDLVDGLAKAVNFNEGISSFLFQFAIRTNPEPNATWFSLDHLTRHNVLEHDASLSRRDAFHGHADAFDRGVFDETRRHWGHGDTVNVVNGVSAIVGRINTSKRTNPEFVLSELGEDFTLGETGAYIAILGDRTTLTVEKRRVEYLFENERLPTKLGWKRSETPFTENDLGEVLSRVREEYLKRTNSTSPAKRSAGFTGRVARGGVRVF